MKELLDNGLIHGDCLTVTGKTVAENLSDIEKIHLDQDVIYSVNKPLCGPGHHIIPLKGNLAPGGCVFKQSGKYLLETKFEGPARVFESEIEANDAILNGDIVKGDVIVNEYERGDFFGELAIVSPDRRRKATVTAQTDMRLFVMTAELYHKYGLPKIIEENLYNLVNFFTETTTSSMLSSLTQGEVSHFSRGEDIILVGAKEKTVYAYACLRPYQEVKI